MTGVHRRVAWNLRHRWRRVFALCVVGGGVLAPLATGLWWTMPLVWFFGLFIVLPVVHTLAKPIPEPAEAAEDDETDPAPDALRRRYARGEIGDREFERRLDRLLETEDAAVAESDHGVASQVRETVERELERVRE